MKKLAVAVALVAVGATWWSCTGPSSTENCVNKVDDNANGLTDCDDPECAGKPVCVMAVDGGNFGTCAKCGELCAKQSECLASGYSNDRPLPMCLSSRCSVYNAETRLNVSMRGDVSLTTNSNSAVLRFVEKAQIDGGTTSCASLLAVRSKTVPDEIESVGGFNFAGWSSLPVGANAPNGRVDAYLTATGTSSAYVLYVELWNGPRSGLQQFPSGKLMSAGCVEMSLPELKEVTDCDGGTSCYPTQIVPMTFVL